MKSICFFAATALCVIGFYSCSSRLAPYGHFQSTLVVADGQANDWTLPLRFSDSKHTYMFSVTNDNKNVYICIYSTDLREQLKMVRAGINVYFDPKGDKNKNIALQFPVQKPNDQNNNSGNYQTTSNNLATVNDLAMASNYYNVTGFKNIENGQIGIGDKRNDIKVAIRLNDDSSLVYEAIVPIVDIPGEGPDGKRNGKNFSVGITVNNLPAARTNNNSNRSNNSPSFRPSIGFGMMGVGMGMGMGGMHGGGGQRRNQQQQSQQPAETNWYQFRLASNG